MAQSSAIEQADTHRSPHQVPDQAGNTSAERHGDKTDAVKTPEVALAQSRDDAYGPGARATVREQAPSAAVSALPQFEGFPASEKAMTAQAARTAEAKPADARTNEAKGAEAKPVEAKPADTAKPAEAKTTRDSGDKPAETKDSTTPSPLTPEGQALLTQAEKRIKVPGYPNAEKEYAQFKSDIEKFEKEAREQGLSPQIVKDTYKGIDRLLQSNAPGHPGLTPDGMPSERQRLRVAEQLMNMVARPEDRQQGSYDTCAMASVEGMLLSGKDRDPSKVTSMVADTALTGHTNVRGVDVKIDKASMQSFGEQADNRAPGENKQRLAENIFRLSAANVYYGIKRAEGSPEGQLSYVSGKDGNHLKYTPDAKDPSKHSAELAQVNQKDGRETGPGPASTMSAESQILNQITGKDYKDRIIVGPLGKGEDPKWVTQLNSQADMEKHLNGLAREGRLPAAIGVFAGSKAFNDGRNPFSNLDGTHSAAQLKEEFKNLFDDGHSVIITGANGKGGFDVKNTWGADSSKQISGSDLYDASKPVSPNEVINNLQFWKIDHVDMNDKRQRESYEAGLGMAALYVVGGYLNKVDGAPQYFKDDYIQAGRKLKSIMNDMPPSFQKELAKDEKDMELRARTDPAMKRVWETWKQLLH